MGVGGACGYSVVLLLHPGNLGRITASATLDDRQCSASKLLRDSAAYAADGCV